MATSIVGLPDSRGGWLSRYESDLLLDLRSAPFFRGIGSTSKMSFRSTNPGSPTKSGFLLKIAFFLCGYGWWLGIEAGSNCIIALANALRASMQV